MCCFFLAPSARALLSYHHLSSSAGQRQWQWGWTEWTTEQRQGHMCVCVFIQQYMWGFQGCYCPCAHLYFTFDSIVQFLWNMLTHWGCWLFPSPTPVYHWIVLICFCGRQGLNTLEYIHKNTFLRLILGMTVDKDRKDTECEMWIAHSHLFVKKLKPE